MRGRTEKSWWREILVGVAVAVVSAIVLARLGLGEKGGATGGSIAPDPRAGLNNDSAQTKKTMNHEVEGRFRSIHGQTGHVAFGTSFVSPPQVKFIPADPRWDIVEEGGGSTTRALQATIIIETTTEGFRWRNTAVTAANDGDILWEVSGKMEEPD